MFDASALAIDMTAVTVTLRRAGSDGYWNDDGEWIPGGEVTSTIRATMQPASFGGAGSSMGLQLKDLPDGVRIEAGWLAWSRTEIRVNDEIDHAGMSFRVAHVWPRREGGFYRAALGMLKDD